MDELTKLKTRFALERKAREQIETLLKTKTRSLFLSGQELEKVNDRLKAKVKELEESEEKFRSMMESIVDPVYICSPDHTIEYMNPAMIDRIGRDATG